MMTEQVRVTLVRICVELWPHMPAAMKQRIKEMIAERRQILAPSAPGQLSECLPGD